MNTILYDILGVVVPVLNFGLLVWLVRRTNNNHRRVEFLASIVSAWNKDSEL